MTAVPTYSIPPAFKAGPGVCTTLPLEDVDRMFFDRNRYPEEGLAVCARCPAMQECRDWATANRIFDGIWGGETQTDRRARLGMKNPEPSWGGPTHSNLIDYRDEWADEQVDAAETP